jgi:hypothetical protein
MTAPYLFDPGTMPGPQLTPSASLLNPPQVAALPAMPAPRPSLLDRVKHGLSSLQDTLMPAPPGAIGGLFDPGEINRARNQGLLSAGLSILANAHGTGGQNAPSVGQALQAGVQSGQNAYNGAIGAGFQMHQINAALEENRRIMAGRQAIYNEIGLPQNGDPTTDKAWVLKALPRLLALGDYKGVQALSPFADKLLAAPPKGAAGDPYINETTNEIRYFDKEAGSSVPPGWKRMSTAGAGTPVIFTGTKNGKPDYQPVSLNDPAKMQQLVAQGYKPDIDSRTQFVQGMVQERADNTLLARTQNAYASQTKNLTDMAEVYNKAYQTLDRAANSTDPNERKLLYGAVESQFTQASEQAKNLRFQLLQYYTKNQNPSLGNTFQTFMDRLTKGQLPPNVLQPMLAHIRALAAENKNQIESRRSAFLKTHQSVVSDVDLPSAESYFTYPGLIGASATPNAGAFDLNAWLKANPPAGKKP